jgi:hypothetical protein
MAQRPSSPLLVARYHLGVRRRVFQTLVVVSLLLSVAIVVLWVRSYSITDQVGRWRRWEERSLFKEECYGIVSQDGAVVIASTTRRWPREFGPGGYGSAGGSQSRSFDRVGWIKDAREWTQYRFRDCYPVWNFVGIHFDVGLQGSSYGESTSGGYLRIPNGFLIAMLLILPSWALVRSVRRKLIARKGCCRVCGYDLRATPDRCPECGTIPVSTSATPK